MLIEFSVRNYRSFWERQTLSMSGSTTKELQEDNSFLPPVKGLPRLLRSAVIYGPNGSGKSNLVKALHFMQEFVLTSSKESQEGERIDSPPFLLNELAPRQASEFEIIFIQDNVRYQYGFKATRQRVIHEWLFAYPTAKAQRWFERSYDPKREKEQWYFGSKFLGSKKTWQDSTRSNALFLSTAVQLNSEQLQPVFTWFKKLVTITHGDLISPVFSADSCEDRESYADILNFLQNADIDVDGIEIKERQIESLPFPKQMPEELRAAIQKDLEGNKKVFFRHRIGDSDQYVSLPLGDESDGTQKLFAYSAPWLDLLKNGRILVVDELDNSFHPQLVRYLLKLIHSKESNKKNGQLIFSTHDTSILDAKILRRDQIWFMEKDEEKATQLYPLTDFHPRKKEALEKGYLQGRYGALPYIGEVKF
ncbi:MAG: ATP-binding protein [Desulfobulbaceae bacterium]|nr:MAG: ATP-binding protein [Desulfobulbaceae bacterium]